MRNHSCSISSRGSELDDRNRNTKNSGNTPWTASPEPGPQPDERAERGERQRDQHRQHHQDDHAPEARLEVQPGGEADGQVDQAGDQRDDEHAGELPEQHRRAPHRRQRQPVQEAGLDVARDRGAGVDRREQRALDERERDREVEVAVGREARDVGRGVQPRHVDPHQDQREQHRRDDHRRLAQRLQHRAARHLVGLRQSVKPRPPPAPPSASSLRPVLARKTSSSDGWCNCRSATRMSAASSARTTATRSSPLSSRTAACPGGDGTTRAEPAEHLGDRVALRAVARARPRPTAARSPPSATPASPRRRSCPRSMIPTRSASTSASSRYCVVRKTVTPSSRASRATSAHRSARLEGSRPVVGSSRNSTRGRVHERQRQIEPALHAARVAADLAVGRVGQPDALDQLVAARAPLRLRHALQRRLQPHVIAARQQRVQRRLLQRGADRRPHRGALADDVVTRHARRARGGRQQRGEHQHRRRLPGAVRPQEAVDLAGRDLQVDPVDGPRAVLEFADQTLNLDARGGSLRHVSSVRGGPPGSWAALVLSGPD